MQPSTQFLSCLSASQTAWTQRLFLEVIRSGQPGSDDPETVLARVKENLKAKVNDDRVKQLQDQLIALPGEALALAIHDIEREKLSREEKRRHRARRVTYYRQIEMQRGSGSLTPHQAGWPRPPAGHD